ncbi:hypothetical protein INT43_003334 [Umbelopsis isabellina]|uniref:SWIM-type domain-containing protein n=1 Tax=Mortierella isabellina TaxID=91625 RepID=A0A8H7PRU4_MORIS|nr:hypothetical protein INT43_003334 [Umbelopsis isabellina]
MTTSKPPTRKRKVAAATTAPNENAAASNILQPKQEPVADTESALSVTTATRRSSRVKKAVDIYTPSNDPAAVVKQETPSTTRKKRAPASTVLGDDAVESSTHASKKTKRVPKPKPENTRKLKKTLFNADVPQAVRGRISRALKQKMFIVDRERVNHREQRFSIIGSTGNVYTVSIAPRMRCNCKDGILRPATHCKHVMLILLRVFHVDVNDPILQTTTPDWETYQKLTANGPSYASEYVDVQAKMKCEKVLNGEMEDEEAESTTKRRPLDTSDCPICFESFSEEEISSIAYCRVCGNNVHNECFDNWKSYQPGAVTCVYCRAPWYKQSHPINLAPAGKEGYVNMAKVLGLSDKRVASSYKKDRFGHYDYEYEDDNEASTSAPK